MALSAAAEPERARRWPAALAWALAGLAVLSLVPATRLLSEVWFEGSPGAAPTIATFGPVGLAVVSAATVGALVASRRPRHPVGWLLLGVGLAVAVNALVEPYVKYGLLVRPGSLPAARHLVGVVYSTFFVALSCAGFVLLLTPTGSLPSPRWRWWARVAAAAPVLTVVGFAVQPDPMAPEYLGNPLAVPVLAPVLLVAGLAGALLVLVGLLAGAGSLMLRFRRARGVERLQLRWLALAAACASVLLLTGLVAGLLGKDPVVLASLALCVALLPLATGAAILRYRLYDLDRIVSRTVAYGLLTVVLGLGYAGAVLAAGQLFGGIGDQPPSWAVAGATLALAAMFQPARRRVQQVVDRRFNRRRPHRRGVRGPAARPGRPGRPQRRAAGRCRPDHAAHPRLAVAPATGAFGGTPTPGLGRRAKLARADENGGHAPNPPRPRRASRSRPGSRLGGRRLLGG